MPESTLTPSQTTAAVQTVEKNRFKAEEYIHNPAKAKVLLDTAVELLKNKDTASSSLAGVWHHLQALVRLLQAYFRGDYREIPWGSIVMAVAAIGYFASPVDFVPDIIPGFGQLDDVVVLSFVINQLKNDLHDFLEWETARQA